MIHVLHNHKRLLVILNGCVAIMAALTILQDVFFAAFNHSSFFLSESALFSSFWLLFVPLIFLQHQAIKKHDAQPAKRKWLLWVATPVIVHLLSYPLLVWLLSAVLYYHTYALLQTFQYTLSAYIHILVVTYGGSALLLKHYHQRPQLAAQPEVEKLSTLTVSSGGKFTPVAVSDILYIVAATPYVTIHLAEKQYLYSETLKSLSEKLDANQFVRIHKSTVVNVHKIQSYKSRLNGDYDIHMQDGHQVRLSRNYAANFKEKMHGWSPSS